MTDNEILEYIKSHLAKDYDLLFGEKKTLIGLYVDYNKEVEKWVKETLQKEKTI